MPIIFPGRRSEKEIPRDWRCCGHAASCCGVPANGFFHAAGTRTSRYAHCREFRGVPRDLRQIHRRAPAGAPTFSDLINLSAGGRRSRTTLAAPFGPFAPRAGGVGADASDGLAFTSSWHPRENFEPARQAVLGPATYRRARAWQDCPRKSWTTEARLLRQPGILLG